MYLNRLLGMILVILCLCLVQGCSTNTKDAEDVEALQSQLDQEDPPNAMPPEEYPSHPPAGGADEAPPGTLYVPGLQFAVPEDWVKERPHSQMRVAQMRLPAGDPGLEDGELVLFYFGRAGGGGPEETLMRWTGQFLAMDGVDPYSRAKRTELAVGDYKITALEVVGDFQSSGMMTGESGSIKTDWGLLGAVVEGGDGPWFIKGTGPSGVMAKHRESYFNFLKSLETR